MKSFIITVDTEGDNLWAWKRGDDITTENSVFLQRFQILCNSYGYKPVWLTNWEMMHDSRFVDFALREYYDGNCEIGMHIHAWNTPPFYELPYTSKSGAPYLIEYPEAVMEDKIKVITEEFIKVFGFQPISHRAGRWAINDKYFALLAQYGYKIDCSITPGINWSKSLGQTPGFEGPDYSEENQKKRVRNGVLEIPLTTFVTNKNYCRSIKEVGIIQGLKDRTKKLIRKKRIIMLRPNGRNIEDMKEIVERAYESDEEYLMFMIHSSELMPGGSPTFPNTESIEKMYKDIDAVFSLITSLFCGKTLGEYCGVL